MTAALSYLFVPGWQDSGPDHWQTDWHAAAIRQFGVNHAQRVQQRDWDHPIRTEWVETLAQHIERMPTPVVLIAHSLGCITVAHLPATVRARIAGAWLVAPADVERPQAPDVLRDFSPIPLEKLSFPTQVVASDNDPYAALGRAQSFAKAWGSEFKVLPNAGHINPDAGYGAWSEGWASFTAWAQGILTS
jgi:predicted alpha/beta hydrolase family esterase